MLIILKLIYNFARIVEERFRVVSLIETLLKDRLRRSFKDGGGEARRVAHRKFYPEEG